MLNDAFAHKRFNNHKVTVIIMDLKLEKYPPIRTFIAALYNVMAVDFKAKDFTDYIHKPFNPKDLYSRI
jgi:uncharacterized ubiquitin-like protein YukD